MCGSGQEVDGQRIARVVSCAAARGLTLVLAAGARFAASIQITCATTASDFVVLEERNKIWLEGGTEMRNSELLSLDDSKSLVKLSGKSKNLNCCRNCMHCSYDIEEEIYCNLVGGYVDPWDCCDDGWQFDGKTERIRKL